MTVLRSVQRSNAFERVRDFDDCAHFHVWHSRLGLEDEVDRKAQEAFVAGHGFVVVGAPGSGKTSTLAAAIHSTDGFEHARLPLRLSVSGAQAADNAHDPRFFASRVVRATAELSREASELVDAAATEGRVNGAIRTWRAQVGLKGSNLSKEIRQRTEDVDFERTPEEVISVARSAVELLKEAGMRPVLLLEDADGILRLPGRSDEDRHEIANAFFVDGLDPLLRELAIPAALAVQPDYLTLDGFRRIALHFEGIAQVPAPSQLSEGALRLLLSETLNASTAPHPLGDVFTDDALGVLLHNRFSLATMRDLIALCAASVSKARDESRARVEDDDVGYALSQS